MGLKDRSLFSSNKRLEAKIKVLTGWFHVSLWLPGDHLLSPSSHEPSVCTFLRLCVSFYSYKDISPVELEPHLDGLNLNHLLKGPISKYRHTAGLQLQHMIFSGTQFSP